MWYYDRLDELKNSENIFYGDEVYILPYYLITDNNTFNDLKKVIITNVDTCGINDKGCEVTGKVITYGEDGFPINNFFSGYAIYRSINGKVKTENGIKTVGFKNGVYFLTDTQHGLYFTFYASNDLYVQLLISGNYSFNSKSEAEELVNKIKIKKCFLCNGKIECIINDVKIIFNDYTVIFKNKPYSDLNSKQELWEHMCNNEKPIEENEYHMDYSKIFLLKNIGFSYY